MRLDGLPYLLLRFSFQSKVPFQQDAFLLQQIPHRIGGLGALLQPIMNPLDVQLDRRGFDERVVIAQFFDIAPVSRPARIGGDDSPEREFLASHATQTKFDCHGVCLLIPMIDWRVLRKAGFAGAYGRPMSRERSTDLLAFVMRETVFIIFFMSLNCLSS